MKKHLHFKTILLCLFIVSAVNSKAQQEFTHTASKENISCNNDCTILDVADLNGNPAAVIFVTPVLDKGTIQNPHPICAYYFKSKWHIFNLDRKAIPAGSKFSVEYFTSLDMSHFQYSFTRADIQADGSAFIDHPSLNNNPAAKFNSFHSWNPGSQVAPLANPEEVTVQYNPGAGKWSISNTNKKPMYARVAYNIAVTYGGNATTNPDSSNKSSASYKAVEIRELIIKATISSVTTPADSLKRDSLTFKKNPKTVIKTDSIAIIKSPADKKNMVPKKPTPVSYDFSNVRICVDKINNNSLPAKPVYVPPTRLPKINSSGQLEQVTTITQGLTGETFKMWSPGDVITVGFATSETSSFIINKVIEIAKEWEAIANIKFKIVNVNQAKVKVGFAKDGTSWSWIGREVLTNPFNVKTVNFGWFDSNTSETEFRRVILHEFGHVLGFVHEHQSPAAGISWDKEKVYAFFALPPDPWDRATVDGNVLLKYTQSSTNFSAYDPLSIMHYFFSQNLTTDGTSFTSNSGFSQTDTQFSKTVYPFPPTPSNATGILHTGDDCDEIEFTVEYNVVPQNEVEFNLIPGRDHHNALVNWWKMIGIQHKSGIVEALELNTSKKIPIFMIDKTKAITFGKAKVLGVHTGLGFTWNPWPAIVGGCRVKFVWRRDSCN